MPEANAIEDADLEQEETKQNCQAMHSVILGFWPYSPSGNAQQCNELHIYGNLK